MGHMEFDSSVLLTYINYISERKFDIMGKTIKSRIKRFCAKYPEPRQYKMKLVWKRKDGMHSAIVGSGEDLIVGGWSKAIYQRNVCKQVYIQHYRYDAETELMECSYAVLSCLTPKENDCRHWKYAERYFIPKEEKQIYDINGNIDSYKVHNTYEYTARNAREFLQAFTKLNCPSESFNEAFMGLTDGHPIVPPRFAGWTEHHWILTEWIRYNSTPRDLENGKTQRHINKLLERELEDVTSIKGKYYKFRENANRTYHFGYRSYFGYYDKLGKVFRIFNATSESIDERYRVYMDGKKFFFANNKTGKWITNGSFTSAQFYGEIINMEDVYALPHCEYLRYIDVKSVYKIVTIMRNPEIEQLCNMGFIDLAKRACNYEYISSGLREMICEPDKKKKNVCARYHLTRNQLEVINNSLSSHNVWGQNDKIKQIQFLLGVKDLSHIDIDSFKKYYNVDTGYRYRMFEMMPVEERKKVFIRIANMNEKHNNALQLMYDTWSMRITGNTDLDVTKIRSYDELVRAHDAAMELRRIQDEERRRLYAMAQEERHKELEKKMAKLDEERAKLNYDEEEFFIRLPKNLSEIVNEGHTLHHCVGGYAETHANGSTTIMFLRRKSEPDKPFYTIEIRNKNIMQIHGFGNCWLGCNPEAIPTVARWLKINDVCCSDQILRGTARGYCGNNILVPMPEI